jgi:hypothetical protein
MYIFKLFIVLTIDILCLIMHDPRGHAGSYPYRLIFNRHTCAINV